ncbi:hypothetical protein OTU49_013356 [Cherax quadricarinatus]|uniref:Protein kinase domain-containing protein n=1 Tax=Cherax quadricarinatus TaxID=27406 RepID=A0AAW0VVQ2_CHEQU
MIENLPYDPKVSIIDFGLSCRNGENIFMSGDPSTYPWIAPEILQRHPSTFASDVYSFGKLIWQLVEVQPSIWMLLQRNPMLSNMLNLAVDHDHSKRPTLPDLLSNIYSCLVTVWLPNSDQVTHNCDRPTHIIPRDNNQTDKGRRCKYHPVPRVHISRCDQVDLETYNADCLRGQKLLPRKKIFHRPY